MSTKAIEEALDILGQLTARKSTWDTIQEAEAELKALQWRMKELEDALSRETSLRESAYVAGWELVEEADAHRQSVAVARDAALEEAAKALEEQAGSDSPWAPGIVRALKRGG